MKPSEPAAPAPIHGRVPPPRRGAPEPLGSERIDAALRAALREDTGVSGGPYEQGDVTARHAVPEARKARARLVCKGRGRLSGMELFARAFELCDPGCRVEQLARDGERIEPGDVLARVEGRARALLTAERTALNFVQRLSGIATLTARYVDRAGPGARILDTRKTTPGLRDLEKYAVRCGGGENHRAGLYDEAMVKNNHLDLAGRGLAEVVSDLRAALGPGVRITAEARDEGEALEGVRGGADVVMLDNFTPERMAAACPRLRALAAELGRQVEIEASGGITEENVARVAASGVERISVGALTHSAPALDLSLYLEPAP